MYKIYYTYITLVLNIKYVLNIYYVNIIFT